MIFHNDEGSWNGGLVFGGRLRNGGPTNGGSLSFDRWRQHKTLRSMSEEDGARREAVVRINGRPDKPPGPASAP